MTDSYLLEAMREVDELTPACPPIAPDPNSPWIEVDVSLGELAEQVVVANGGVLVYRGASPSVRRYADLVQAQLMQNAANRSMTPEELARYNRGMQNAWKP